MWFSKNKLGSVKFSLLERIALIIVPMIAYMWMELVFNLYSPQLSMKWNVIILGVIHSLVHYIFLLSYSQNKYAIMKQFTRECIEKKLIDMNNPDDLQKVGMKLYGYYLATITIIFLFHFSISFLIKDADIVDKDILLLSVKTSIISTGLAIFYSSVIINRYMKKIVNDIKSTTSDQAMNQQAI